MHQKKCLHCGKIIPEWYQPQLCDYCLEKNGIKFYEFCDVPSGTPKVINEDSAFPDIISLIGMQPDAYIEIRKQLIMKSASLLDGSLYYGDDRTKVLKIIKDSNKLKDVKWWRLIEN